MIFLSVYFYTMENAELLSSQDAHKNLFKPPAQNLCVLWAYLFLYIAYCKKQGSFYVGLRTAADSGQTSATRDQLSPFTGLWNPEGIFFVNYYSLKIFFPL